MDKIGTSMKSAVKRNSALELLRLIAIFAIIGHHFVVHGIFPLDILSKEAIKNNCDFSLIFDSLFFFGGMFGNSCFILITGYFMVKKTVNWKKIFLLIVAMYFYYWLVLAIFGSLQLSNIRGSQMFNGLAPFLFDTNWFVCCYIFFCLLVPFINHFLLSISRQQYKKFLIIIFSLSFFLPALKVETYLSPQGICLFSIMYAFGAYIRIHGLNGRYNRIKFWNKVIAGTLILLVVVPAGNIAISGRIGGSLNDLLAAILAISLFARLVLQPPFTSLFVNRMAQSVLGVYLIHDNSFVRHFLWCDWLPNASYLHTNMMVPVFVAKVLMIFIVCMLIDQIRLFIIEKPVSLWLNNHWKWIRNKFIFITGRIKNELS